MSEGVPLGRIFGNLLRRESLFAFICWPWSGAGALLRLDSHLQQKYTVLGAQQQLVRVLAHICDRPTASCLSAESTYGRCRLRFNLHSSSKVIRSLLLIRRFGVGLHSEFDPFHEVGRQSGSPGGQTIVVVRPVRNLPVLCAHDGGSVQRDWYLPPPGGTNCSISPGQVTLNGVNSAQASVTVAVDKHATVGTYTLTLKGTSGSITHSTTVTLTIN